MNREFGACRRLWWRWWWCCWFGCFEGCRRHKRWPILIWCVCMCEQTKRTYKDCCKGKARLTLPTDSGCREKLSTWSGWTRPNRQTDGWGLVRGARCITKISVRQSSQTQQSARKLIKYVHGVCTWSMYICMYVFFFFVMSVCSVCGSHWLMLSLGEQKFSYTQKYFCVFAHSFSHFNDVALRPAHFSLPFSFGFLPFMCVVYKRLYIYVA